MNKKDLLINQIFVGIGTGVIGFIIAATIDFYLIKSDLFMSVIYGIVGGLLGMFIGVNFMGFQYYKKNNRLNEFLLSSFISFIYLVISSVLYFVLGFFIGNGIIIYPLVLLPLIGMIYGFNLKI